MGRSGCGSASHIDNGIGRVHFHIGQGSSDSATIKTTTSLPCAPHVGPPINGRMGAAAGRRSPYPSWASSNSLYPEVAGRCLL